MDFEQFYQDKYPAGVPREVDLNKYKSMVDVFEQSVKKFADRPAFSAVGKEVGLEIWRIEKLLPVPVPKETYGKFFTGDSYIVLNTYKKNPKSNTLNYDIHYWLGKYFVLPLT